MAVRLGIFLGQIFLTHFAFLKNLEQQIETECL